MEPLLVELCDYHDECNISTFVHMLQYVLASSSDLHWLLMAVLRARYTDGLVLLEKDNMAQVHVDLTTVVKKVPKTRSPKQKKRVVWRHGRRMIISSKKKALIKSTIDSETPAPLPNIMKNPSKKMCL